MAGGRGGPLHGPSGPGLSQQRPLPVHKSEEELQAILAAKEQRLQLKAQRQAQQAQNVQRKREQREAHRCVGLGGPGGLPTLQPC